MQLKFRFPDEEIKIDYHPNQKKIFFESDARFKIIAKGRRFGFTRGLANFVIDKMYNESLSPILWVDTTYSNIQRYFDRYFFPLLKPIDKNQWFFNRTRTELKLNDTVCDFRSADRPENLEGFGYRLIILNEAGIILNDSSLWNESIRPMALDYQASVIIGGTPKGKRNKKGEQHLFFELFSRGNSGEPNWLSYNFSSYDNPLILKSEIDDLAKEISPALRDQEIFGKFIDSNTTAILKREWWKFKNCSDINPDNIIRIIQSWDTAFKKSEENDFSVCTTWFIMNDYYFLADLWRGRVEFPDLKRKFIELYEKFHPSEVLIEDKASGISLIQELESGTRIPVKKIKIDSDKVSRCHSITPLIEAGKVFIDNLADWKNDFIDECESFPEGQFDDRVDSVTQFLNYARVIQFRYELKDLVRTKRYIPDRYKNFRI